MDTPQAQTTLNGVVTLEGSATHPAFLSYSLAFAYDPNPTETWFPLGEALEIEVSQDRLGLWDTTQISDGLYQLKLTVLLEDGSRLESITRALRVSNDSPTPAPTAGFPASIADPATQPATVEAGSQSETPADSTTNQQNPISKAFWLGAGAGSLSLLIIACAFWLHQRLRAWQGRLRMRQIHYERRPRRGKGR
jgi:hypothetical protein